MIARRWAAQAEDREGRTLNSEAREVTWSAPLQWAGGMRRVLLLTCHYVASAPTGFCLR